MSNACMAAVMVLAQAHPQVQNKPLLEIGVLITALLGLLNLGYSLRHNRRSSYVGAVTAARVKWIDELRKNFARFLGLIHQSAFATPSDPIEHQKILQEIVQLRMLMKLQLIPTTSKLDRELADQIDAIFLHADSISKQHLAAQLDDAMVAGQGLLWGEWRKVKDEAIYGDPYDTLKYRIKKWSDRMDAQLEEPDDPAREGSKP